MNPVERRMAIMERLQAEGKATLEELASQLGVSTMTIRRDLAPFVQQDAATVSSGTVYLTNPGSGIAQIQRTPADDALARHKRSIARVAAEQVHDGDTIIVDCGTTALQMVNYLAERNVTIITNSLPVAGSVGGNPNIRLVYAPGEYSLDSVGVVGQLTVDFFKTIRADKAFLGAHAFDAAGGANEPVLGDATTKRAMIEAASTSYLLVDSSKYGNVHFMALSRLDDFSCVITDADFPTDKRPELEAACNRVIYA